MTTVAANNRMIAADTQYCNAGIKSRGRKLYQARDWYVGIAGNVAAGMEFVKWARGSRIKRPPRGDYTALILTTKGALILYENGQLTPTESPDAIGTGAAAALAAMRCGRTPADAVRVAAKIDVFTGGRIHKFVVRPVG